MIKLNTAYRTKKDYYIVILRNPKTRFYEMYCSVWLSELQDFNYLLREGNPFFVFYNLSDARYYARKTIDGEGCLF